MRVSLEEAESMLYTNGLRPTTRQQAILLGSFFLTLTMTRNAPELISKVLPNPAEKLCLRIAVHAIESWLLADQRGVARFLGVSRAKIPDSPDLVPDPKSYIVELARRSHKTDIRRELVPRPESGKRVGPAYSSRIIEFALYHWDCVRAEESSQSLRSCKLAVQSLAEKVSSKS